MKKTIEIHSNCIPSHLNPSPMYPILQTHICRSGWTSIQSAFTSQSAFFPRNWQLPRPAIAKSVDDDAFLQKNDKATYEDNVYRTDDVRVCMHRTADPSARRDCTSYSTKDNRISNRRYRLLVSMQSQPHLESTQRVQWVSIEIICSWS